MIIKLNVNDEEFDALWNGVKLLKDASQYLTHSYQKQCIDDLVDPLICMMDEAYTEARRELKKKNEGKDENYTDIYGIPCRDHSGRID